MTKSTVIPNDLRSRGACCWRKAPMLWKRTAGPSTRQLTGFAVQLNSVGMTDLRVMQGSSHPVGAEQLPGFAVLFVVKAIAFGLYHGTKHEVATLVFKNDRCGDYIPHIFGDNECGEKINLAQ